MMHTQYQSNLPLAIIQNIFKLRNMLEFPFPDFKSWASLLGLLSPAEYFVTVDHSVLWQRHVSWAKPKGEDLRQYVTQRFSSNMVVCSLMMGAKLSVFFNSSVESTEMRRMLRAEDYGNLKFWIGHESWLE